jgi:hypothetical protein
MKQVIPLDSMWRCDVRGIKGMMAAKPPGKRAEDIPLLKIAKGIKGINYTELACEAEQHCSIPILSAWNNGTMHDTTRSHNG